MAKSDQWTASSIEQVRVEDLLPYARNARTHSAAQVRQIAASIREFGFVNPVLVDEAGEIIAGHGRVMAARQIGLDVVPVIRRTGLTAAQKRGLRLADNKIALGSGWDDALLAAELAELASIEGFDVSVTGFDVADIDAIIRSATGADAPMPLPDGDETDAADAEVEQPRERVTRTGDTWRLGDHRLRCGSSVDAADVAALLGEERPHLMVTDPPYGVEYDPGWRKAAGVSASPRVGRVLNDHRADWREAWALFPGDVAYVWHADSHAREVVESLESQGFVMRAQIIWGKRSLVMGRGDYHHQHEPCWYSVRKGRRGHWSGNRQQSTLWSIATQGDAAEDSATPHSTQKPVECMRRPMMNNSRIGDAVYEPFCGSGTTIIAGQTTGRRVLAMELSAAYVDVAVLRWQAFTGLDATLDAPGAPTFDALAAERASAADASATTKSAAQEPPGGA